MARKYQPTLILLTFIELGLNLPPMKNGHSKLIKSPSLRYMVSLVVVYFGLVNPVYHLHHSHDDGSANLEISAHPIEVDIENASEHHHDHHDGDRPHSNDHQHEYVQQITWHATRAQSPKTLNLDNISSCLSGQPDIAAIESAPYIDDQEPVLIANYLYSHVIVRGPPLS